jgi:hypothetical protein
VNVTEQLPADNTQLVALNEPPVVPTVNVNVTVPDAVFDGVVVSATVAVTLVEQLVAPNAMLQPPFRTVTVVVVLSFATVTVVEPLLPLCCASPP